MGEQDDLIDYSTDEEDVPKTKSAPVAAAKEDPKTGGSYVGVHATGFRDFLLKPELLKAIGECGFEHPSEGTATKIKQMCSSTGMYSSSNFGYGRYLPSQVWYG